MSDPNRRPKSEDPDEWDEPVFGRDNREYDDEPHFDEPVFGADGTEYDRYEYDRQEDDRYEDDRYEDEEPSFAATPYPRDSAFDPDDDEIDYVPDSRVTESLAVGASAGGSNMLSRQSRRATGGRGEPNADPSTPGSGRRLGRTGPFWLMGAGALIVVLLIVLLFLLQGNGNGVADVQTVTPAASGELGSVTFPQTGSISVTAVLTPTAAPPATFDAGQRVVVTNTVGQGIRLRNQPGTGALTLEIIQEGAVFTVLNPDGDFAQYPVEADGYRWYRIQVADTPESNLTGWAAADFLAAE
ncbi:hypothetical protein GC175_06335 [bacterium]|nr:hypothetical protein [bacterium]